VPDISTHPHLDGRQLKIPVSEAGRLLGYTLGPGFDLSGAEARQLGPAPTIGQHTRPILEQLGYSAQQIDSLLADGIIGAR